MREVRPDRKERRRGVGHKEQRAEKKGYECMQKGREKLGGRK